MIDDIDRRTLMGADKEEAGDRRQPLFWLLWALLIFFVLFGCGQIAMRFDSGGFEDVQVRSGLTVDYGIWTPVAFGGINPLIIAEAAGDNGGGIFLASDPSDSCFLLGDCTPNPPTSTPGPSATPTLTPTSTPTPTNTPTVTGTLPPTYTFTPIYTPTNTPTPTPLVYPIKLALPQNIPPGNTSLRFDIIVINYGNPTGADLTQVIDTLPAGMSYAPGTCSPVPCSVAGNQVIWNFAPAIPITQGSFYRLSLQANVSGTSPGDVLTNQVETSGGNFATSVNVKRVYVYTPTPTATPIEVPIANNDSATTNEDTSVNIDVLSNDTQLRDVPLTVSVIGAPPNGSTAVVGSPGLPGGIWITYTPRADYFGPDSFVYQLCDASVPIPDCDTATVSITVFPINDVPIAQDDVATTNEDTPRIVQVLGDNGNGADVNFDYPITVTITSGPSNGVIALPLTVVDPAWPPAANFTYTPNANWNGVDTFIYQISDMDGDTDSAQVDITVNSVNDAPVANDDIGAGPPVVTYFVDEDNILIIPPPPCGLCDPTVLDNDFDIDGDPLEARLPSLPSNGIVTLNLDGTFSYTPNANFSGLDSFTYRAYDGVAYSNAATVRITVNQIDDGAPVAVDDDVSTNEDTGITIQVLADNGNGTDTNLDLPLTIRVTVNPANGNVVPGVVNLNAFPLIANFTYTPDPDWFGTDTFTYEIEDAEFETDTALVSVTVIPQHDPPDAINDAYSIDEDDPPTTFSVLLNDANGDATIVPSTVRVISSPSNGTATENGDGTIDYDSDLNFTGIDSFTYVVDDDYLPIPGTSLPATVTINVQPLDDPAIAVDDIEHTSEGVTVNSSVLNNDSGDPPLSLNPLLIAPFPTDGICTAISGDRIRYIPNPGFFGSDSCGYEMQDDNGDTDNATLTIYINDPPEAFDDFASTNEEQPVTINVLADNGNGPDVDIDDGLDPASVNIVTGPSNGVAVENGDGTVTYTPGLDYNSPPDDCFEYTVDDLNMPPPPGAPPATSNRATVCVTVNPVNDDPDAVDDGPFLIQRGDSITVDVLANDTDVDLPPDILTVTFIENPASWSNVINGDNTVTLVPPGGFNGTEVLNYSISDGNGGSDTAVITLDVNAPPTAEDDIASTNEDASVIVAVLADNGNGPDTDPDPLDILTVTGTSGGPSNGSVTILPGNNVRYTPDPDYNGPDSFDYTISDGNGGTDSATVFISVVPAPDLPNAFDDVTSTNEDTMVSIDVLANDLGLGDLDLVVGVNPPGAAAVVGSPGTPSTIRIQYTPPPEFSGVITFDYQVTDEDGLGQSSTATVTVTVNAVNDSPNAVDDGSPGVPFTTQEDTAVTIPDVTTNDSDIETSVDPTTVQISSPPTGGSAVSNGDGSITYTPNINFTGPDSFEYTVADLGSPLPPATSNPATVFVYVQPENDPPVAVNDSRSTNQQTPVTIPVLGNDYDPDVPPNLDPSTVGIVTGPTNGSITGINPVTGAVTYAPFAGSFTSDSFTYNVQDTVGATSNTATVTININPPNLVVSKDANWSSYPAPANIGENVQFFISVINNGPGIAYGVTISDSLGDCFSWISPPNSSIGDMPDPGAAVQIGMARVVSAPPGCTNSNVVNVTSSNGGSASASVFVDIQAPMGAGAPMMMSMSVDTPTATVQVGAIPSSTATTTPPTEIVGTPVAPTETAGAPSIPSETLPAPSDTPSGPAPTDTPSGPAPTETPSGPAPTETMSGPEPTATEEGAPLPTATPVMVPTPTPVAGAPTSTEATFTLLIPLTMMIGPFIYAWYQRIRFARRSS